MTQAKTTIIIFITLSLFSLQCKQGLPKLKGFAIEKTGDSWFIKNYPCKAPQNEQFNKLVGIGKISININISYDKNSKEKLQCLNSLEGIKNQVVEIKISQNKHQKKRNLRAVMNETYARIIKSKFNNLERIRSDFGISDKALIQLSQLKKLVVLKLPSFYGVGSQGLSAIGKMRTLAVLSLNLQKNTQVKSLKRLNHLSSLIISCSCNDVGPISFLTQLTNLEVNSRATNFSSFKKLFKLEKLKITSPLNNLRFLKNMRFLKKLDISNTQIKDLTPLKNLKKLVVVNIKNLKIKNLSAISHVAQIIK